MKCIEKKIMASNSVYNRIFKLIQRWPIDKKKQGRDFGEYLQQHINQALKSNSFVGKEHYWDKQYLIIQRLLSNEHKQKYTRTLSSSSTGLSADECNLALTKEVLEYFIKDNTPLLKRITFSKKK